MTYFLASNVCEKIGIRNSTDVFKQHNLINGRDYIRFTYKANPLAYNQLISLGYAKRISNGVYLFTIMGVLTVLFRSKNPESKEVKDKLLNLGGYEIYESVAYNTVSKIISNLTDIKKDKFFSDEPYALNFVKSIIGGDNMTADVIKSVEMIRTFHAKEVNSQCVVPEIDLRILVSEFNGFSLV